MYPNKTFLKQKYKGPTCKILYLQEILTIDPKHEQQCLIRYKDTRRRRSRVSLGLIKHALRIDAVSSLGGEVIFKKYVV